MSLVFSRPITTSRPLLVLSSLAGPGLSSGAGSALYSNERRFFAVYGFVDLACPSRVYTLKAGVTSLGDVWRHIRRMGNVGIVRLSDNRLIWRRVSNHRPEILA
jgi:hypothetical protein